METQVLPADTRVLESIQSFGQETAPEIIRPTNMRHDCDKTKDNGLDCLCQIFVRFSILTSRVFSIYYMQQTEDQLLFCDGACKKWFHIWFVY